MELQPQAERLQHWLDILSDAEVGGTPGGGVSRPAASAADGLVRDRFKAICEDLGLRVSVDDAGNMYALRAAIDPDADPVVIGSHLDTVTPGGRFDGILGVAEALEVVATLNDSNAETLRPIIVVNWMGEEGARFPPAMLGSGLVAGFWDAEYVHSRTDNEGVALGDALVKIGYLGDAENRLKSFFAALEVHIEQGTQLEESGSLVGVVPFIEPVHWSTVRVRGIGGHAGGSPTSERREALVAAARMIAETRDLTAHQHVFRTTVGKINVLPGSTNVIPHEVEFSLDIRSSDTNAVEDLALKLEQTYRRIASEEGVDLEMIPDWSLSAIPFSEKIRDQIRTAAERRDIPWEETIGVIGHDSVHLSHLGPTAMIFAQTRAGVSHAENEFAPWPSVIATTQVLADATFALAMARSLDDLTTSFQR